VINTGFFSELQIRIDHFAGVLVLAVQFQFIERSRFTVTSYANGRQSILKGHRDTTCLSVSKCPFQQMAQSKRYRLQRFLESRFH
jgi:hypothetical protein